LITEEQAVQIVDTIEESLLAAGITTFFFCLQRPVEDGEEETTAHYTGAGELAELVVLLEECKEIIKDSAS
jgi:methylaspartate ammonia-lyase